MENNISIIELAQDGADPVSPEELFMIHYMFTEHFSNLGEHETIESAANHAGGWLVEHRDDVGRKWAARLPDRMLIVAPGLRGYVAFDSLGEVHLSERYKKTLIYTERQDHVTNLLRKAAEEGHPVASLVECLDICVKEAGRGLMLYSNFALRMNELDPEKFPL